MKAEYVLNMINEGQIDILKEHAQNEIYERGLLKGSGERDRRNAIKRLYEFNQNEAKKNSNYERLVKPFKFEKNGTLYSVFMNLQCIAYSTESFDFDFVGTTFNLSTFFNTETAYDEFDFRAVVAKAKSFGYRLNKSTLALKGINYMLNYKDAYFNIAVLDQAFSMIDDNKNPMCIYEGEKKPFYLKSGIGQCMILPIKMNRNGDSEVVGDKDHIIIKYDDLFDTLTVKKGGKHG